MEIRLQAPVQVQMTRTVLPVDTSEKSKIIHERVSEAINVGKLDCAKHLFVDLSGLAGVNRLLTQSTDLSSKVTADSSIFTDNRYYNVTDDAIFRIEGISFTKNEIDKARKVMKNAISYLPTAGSSLDYKDYASMGIAINSVSDWADSNLSEEQSGVIKKAIRIYMDFLSFSERENQQNMGVVIDSSKYYGATVCNDETDMMINKLRDHLSKVTGMTYTPTSGNVVTLQSATNHELTSAIRELFTNVDLSDSDSVKQAYHMFKVMVTPAYNTYGITNQQNGLNNLFKYNINGFEKQISESNAFNANMGINRIDIRV